MDPRIASQRDRDKLTNQQTGGNSNGLTNYKVVPITEDILNHQQSIQLENTAIKREIFDDDDALNGAVHTNGVSEVGTPLPNEALGSNEEIKKCPIQFEDVFAAGDSEEEDAKMNSMLSARKPSAYELEQIVKQKREADEKQRQEEEEFSMGDFSRESTLVMELDLKISNLGKNWNRAGAAKKLLVLHKEGRIIPILKAAVGENDITPKWLSLQFFYQRIGQNDEIVCSRALMELATQISNCARNRVYNVEEISNRLRNTYIREQLKADELDRIGVRTPDHDGTPKRPYSFMPVVDDEDRYSSKKRANLTFNELIRGKSSAEESSTLVTLKAEYNPEDDEDMEDQGYEDAYEAEDFREEGMDHYNELFDNDEDYDRQTDQYQEQEITIDLQNEDFRRRQEARTKAQGENYECPPLPSNARGGSRPRPIPRQPPTNNLNRKKKTQTGRSSKREPAFRPEMEVADVRDVLRPVTREIDNILRIIFDADRFPGRSIIVKKGQPRKEKRNIRFAPDTNPYRGYEILQYYPPLMNCTTEKFILENYEISENVDPHDSCILPSSDKPVTVVIRVNPEKSADFSMNEIKRLKMELHAQLTENIKLNSRARNIFIYDSILRDLNQDIFITKNGASTFAIHLHYPTMPQWLIQQLDRWYADEKKLVVNVKHEGSYISASRIFLAIGMDMKIYYAGPDREETGEVLKFLINLRDWFQEKTNQRTKRDICFGTKQVCLRPEVQVGRELWRVNYMPRFILITVPEIGTYKNPIRGLNQCYRQFVEENKDHFDLLDWAILCAQNLDQSESVEDRTKLLIQKMAADFDFIYK